jgi:acyl-coenzyme A thioesterase PaaI-like protein
VADLRPPDDEGGGHIMSETGLSVRLDGDGLAGRAQVAPELHVPGTDVLRTSVLAAYADMLTGLLAMGALPGRVPVTLDLAVDVVAPVRGCPVLEARCRLVKAGRSVLVLSVDFTVGGDSVALGSGTFVPSPDVRFSLPPLADLVADMARRTPPPLRKPLAERADCARRSPGVAAISRREDGLNATSTVNGGLLALAAEEAVLSTATPGSTLSSLTLRYLRPVRVGPVLATATTYGSFARIDVRDEGADGRLAVAATARTA